MLVPILLLCFAVHLGNTHPDQRQPSITRVLARQNTATATAFKPPITTRFSGSCQSRGWSTCGNACADIKNGATCCDPSASYSKLHTP